MRRLLHTACVSALAGLAFSGFGAPSAANAKELFSGKTVRVLIGYAAGGGYDRYGRQVARHIGRHLPGNPTVVAVNMPGAGGRKVVTYLYNNAPKDGTEFGIFARSIPLLAFSGKEKVKFDPLKLTWIGTSSSYKGEAYLMVVRKDTGLKTFADVRNTKTPITFPATSFGTDGHDVPLVLRNVFGIPSKCIRGYPGGNSLYLAVDRNETNARMVGYASMKTARPGWLKPDGPINVVLQFATKTRLPQFPDVPTAQELAKTKEDKALLTLMEAPFYMARPFAGPPNLPADVTKALRDGFMAAHEDPRYKAEAKKVRLLTSPVRGDKVQKLVEELGTMPRSLYARYVKILEHPNSVVRKVNWIKVSGVVTKVGKKGRFAFKIDGKGKAQKARMRGRHTKVKVNGKKAKSKAVKVGMKCNIWWEGPKSTPGRVECEG